jgi:flagellar basal body-associated protein FliL
MSKKAVAVVVIVIVIVGLVFVAGGPLWTGQKGTQETETSGRPTEQIPAATGNIDDAIDAALQDIPGDEAAVGETDSSLLSENDEAINGFGQSLDTTQF